MPLTPRRKGGWVDRLVRVNRDLENQAGFTFQKGTVMRVLRNFGGLHLEALFICGSCSGGKARTIKKIPEHWVELLPEGYEETPEDRLLRGAEATLATRARLAEYAITEAKRIILDGLRYHEHDGHNMPKRVAREALTALGTPLKEQP